MSNSEIPSKFEGAAVDLDDTTLDNKQSDNPGQSLHEQSTLAATREIGEKYDIPEIHKVSAEDSFSSFVNAPHHTHESGIRQLFIEKGITTSHEIDIEAIIREIVDRKEELHEKILWEQGEPVEGSIEFLYDLVEQHRLDGKISLATSATQGNAYTFIKKHNLFDLFPPERTITTELVTHQKPNPQTYNLAFASLGLPEEARSSTLGLEDAPKGIQSALGAHLFSAAVQTHRYSTQKLMRLDKPPHLVAASYEDLREILRLPKRV